MDTTFLSSTATDSFRAVRDLEKQGRRDAVLDLVAPAGSIGLTLRVPDRFGDHGLVVVRIATPDEDSAGKASRIDTVLISCRVIGRIAEHYLFGLLPAEAKARRGYRRLLGEYIPSSKNSPVADLYDRLGFRRVENDRDGPEVHYELDVIDAPMPVTFVLSTPAG